jgi:hypothetical protein
MGVSTVKDVNLHLNTDQDKTKTQYFEHLTKVGGLDSQDQLRSRSRMSFVSRLTFENRRECPSCRDQLFFFSVKIFKIEIFQSRFIFVKILIEIYENYSYFLIEIEKLSRFLVNLDKSR